MKNIYLHTDRKIQLEFQNVYDMLQNLSAFLSPGTMMLFRIPKSLSASNNTDLPNGWLLCNGQEYSRTAYPELFNTIGLTFGVPNGFNSFKVPNITPPINNTTYGIKT